MGQRKESKKKKDHILDSAIKLVQKIGFEETTIRAICDVANISIGTFYHYYSDKQELLSDILKMIDSFLVDEIVPKMTKDTELENLRIYVEGFAKDTKQTGSSYGSVISTTLIPLPQTQEDIKKEHLRPLYMIPMEVIKRGQENGEFTKEFLAEELVDKLIMSLRGCSMEWARRNYTFDVEVYMLDFFTLYARCIRK